MGRVRAHGTNWLVAQAGIALFCLRSAGACSLHCTRDMSLDRNRFLFIAAALATAAGCDTKWAAPAPAPAAPAAAPSVVAPALPIPVDILPATTAVPVCDDSQGSAEECPSVGPSDEGVC